LVKSIQDRLVPNRVCHFNNWKNISLFLVCLFCPTKSSTNSFVLHYNNKLLDPARSLKDQTITSNPTIPIELTYIPDHVCFIARFLFVFLTWIPGCRPRRQG